MVRVRRIRHGVRIETFTFVFDAKINVIVRQAAEEPDFFGRVGPVTMLDGIDKCFFQSEIDGKQLLTVP